MLSIFKTLNCVEAPKTVMFFPASEVGASNSTLQAKCTPLAALEDFVRPSPPTCLDESLLHLSMNLVYEDGMEMECVCSIVSPWRCQQASLFLVSISCSPAARLSVFLYLCLSYHILPPCTKIRNVVGLNIHHLQCVFNVSSHFIKTITTLYSRYKYAKFLSEETDV